MIKPEDYEKNVMSLKNLKTREQLNGLTVSNIIEKVRKE